jgi:probable O-glycosylation ligase (exosortase A-associated)
MNGLLFTYLMTYGGAVVSLFNPYYGLLIYICFAIVKPPALWPWCVPIGNYSRVIGIALLAGWAINGFGDRSLGKAKPIVVCVLGYFVWVVLSTALSPDPELGMPFIEYLIKIILPFLAGVTLINSRERLQTLLWVILGSCAFLAYEANLMYLQHFDFEHGHWFSLDNNSVSILMMTSFGLALILALEETVLWRRILCLGIAAAMAHVPMFGASRGGMMGACVAAITAVIITPKNRHTWMMIVVGAVIAFVLVGPSVVARFDTAFKPAGERDGSAQSRIDLWRDCIDAMIKHPVFGIGQDRWGIVVTEYGWPARKEAHSLWFQTAAELGVPGVAFLIGFYFYTCYLPWHAARTLEVPWMPRLSRMLIVSIAGFASSASFVTVEGFELPYYVALISACGVKLAYEEAERNAAYAYDDGGEYGLDSDHKSSPCQSAPQSDRGAAAATPRTAHSA